MNVRFGFAVPVCLLLAASGFGAPSAHAQTPGSTLVQPPQMLEVITETLKPGEAGSPHEKSESAIAEAMRKANWPEHYVGMNSLSGVPRAVFFVGYNSFAAYEQDIDNVQDNATLAAALDAGTIADGALLTSSTTSLYTYREDMSLRALSDPGLTRFYEVTIFHIRGGHLADWGALLNLYIKVYGSDPTAHWATYEKQFGDGSGTTFIIVTPMRSLSEVDHENSDGRGLPVGVTPAMIQQMHTLAAATITSSTANLYAVNPNLSYADPVWIQEAPQFWGPK